MLRQQLRQQHRQSRVGAMGRVRLRTSHNQLLTRMRQMRIDKDEADAHNSALQRALRQRRAAVSFARRWSRTRVPMYDSLTAASEARARVTREQLAHATAAVQKAVDARDNMQRQNQRLERANRQLQQQLADYTVSVEAVAAQNAVLEQKLAQQRGRSVAQRPLQRWSGT